MQCVTGVRVSFASFTQPFMLTARSGGCTRHDEVAALLRTGGAALNLNVNQAGVLMCQVSAA
jgi:hypothetical protein